MDEEAGPSSVGVSQCQQNSAAPQSRERGRTGTKDGRPEDTIDTANQQKGYPRITRDMAGLSSLQSFRRFKRTRMRLILAKQDRVTQLEDELDQIDQQEEREIYLAGFRMDKSEKRWEILRKLEAALAEYDSLVQNANWAINMHETQKRHMPDLQFCIREPGLITEEESKYVTQKSSELMYIGKVGENGQGIMLDVAETVVYATYKAYHICVGTREMIYIPRQIIRRVGRAFTASVAIVVLLVPIIILNTVQATVWRFLVIFLAATLFVSLVTITSTASMGEVFIGGATYAAVLVVFISQNGV